MRTQLFISLLICWAFTACEKVPLEPNTHNYSGDPLFFTDLTIDGSETSFVVGENAEIVSVYEDIGNLSMVNTTLNDAAGNPHLELDFLFPGEFTEHSFDNSVSFVLQPSVNYAINIADLTEGGSVTLGTWYLEGQNHGTVLQISDFGVFDVDLEVNELLGLDANFILKDRLIVGGIETNEPEFVIHNPSSNNYVPELTTTPPEVDEVRWYIGSDFFGDKQYFDPLTGIELLDDYGAITCEFYSQGVLINVKSILISSSMVFPGTLMEISTDLTSLTSGSLINETIARIGCYHNGDYYSTESIPSVPAITFSNVHAHTEAVTGHEYIVATIHFDSYLMNANSESIHVVFSGDFGFRKSP